MRKSLKFFGLVAFGFLFFLVVAAIAFYHLISVGEFRRFLISEIEQKTELKVQLGEADLAIGRILGVSFHDLVISDGDAGHPAITAERFTARVALLPLFKRQLIFYELRLEKPNANIVRDKDGRFPLLERLINLPFLKQEGSQFGLDLRTIKIQNGTVEFQDQRSEGEAVVTRFHDIDLDLERIRGQQLRAFLGELVKLKHTEPQGAALEFALKSTVTRDNRNTILRAKGKMVFPTEALEFGKAWWNAQVELSELSGEMLSQYADGLLPVKSISGEFAPRFRLEGNPSDRLQLKGEVIFKGLALEAPDIFTSVLAPGDGRAEFDIDWTPKRLGLARLDVRSKEIKFALDGEIRSLDTKDPLLRLNLTAPTSSLAVIRKYLPAKMINSPQLDSALVALQEGDLQLKKAGINGTVSQIRSLLATGGTEGLWFDAELRNVTVNPGTEGALPLRGLNGRVTFEKGALTFNNLKGAYGQSHLVDFDGTYQVASPGGLAFHARGELDLAELREQLRAGILANQTVKLGSYLSDVGGRGRFDLTLSRPADGPPQLEGMVILDSARLRTDELAFTDLKGNLLVFPKEIRGNKIRGLLSGSPIQIQLTLKDYAAENGTFDLAIESPGMKAGSVTRLLMSSGSLQDPGTVRGLVRYQGSFGSGEGRKFTGNLDLAGVQLAMYPLLQPLRDVNGRIHIDEQGIDMQGMKGLIVGTPFDFSGRWRYTQKPQLLFNLSSPNLDLGYLLTQIDPELGEVYDKLEAVGKINLTRGRYKGFEFGDLKSDVVLDHRVWRLTNVLARSAGGTIQGSATIRDKPDILGFTLAPKIQGVPVQGFLDWFDAKTTEMTGKVSLSGNLESVGSDATERRKNLNGALNLRIEDGTILRLRILVQLLNLLDLSRWFTLQLPDLTKQGIRFHAITADFKVTKGVFSTENLVVDSDDLRMTGAGKIDVAKDEIDFVVAVRPFAGIDTVMNYIPLVGWGIAAIKNSFLVASFNISGPIDDPSVTPAPLGTLSEWFLGVLGIPKNMIGLGGDDKKDAIAQDPTKEPLKEKAPVLGK